MTEQAIEARRAYKRKWAKENRDKIRKQQERYWTKRAEAESRAAKATAKDMTPEE